MWKALLWITLAGCWSESLVDDTFTREQWDQIQKLRLPLPPAVPGPEGALLAQHLFFEPRLSGEILVEDPKAEGHIGEVERIRCATCHDPDHDFADGRAMPGNISIGTGYTPRNALSLVNVAYKRAAADLRCAGDAPAWWCANVYSWSGKYETAGKVLDTAALGKAAMNTTEARMAAVVRDTPAYREAYTKAYGPLPDDDHLLFLRLEDAFDSYVRSLISRGSAFDRYLAGVVDADGRLSTHDRLTDAERRGLAVFVGKGMCIECHSGELLSDLEFHVTGVPQQGFRVPLVDEGFAETARIAGQDSGPEVGKFLTPPLRNVALTAPYMHAGQLATLGEVIAFYRAGGGSQGFAGVKDPRLQPLDLDDRDAADLEAFLRTLTGDPVDPALRGPP